MLSFLFRAQPSSHSNGQPQKKLKRKAKHQRQPATGKLKARHGRQQSFFPTLCSLFLVQRSAVAASHGLLGCKPSAGRSLSEPYLKPPPWPVLPVTPEPAFVVEVTAPAIQITLTYADSRDRSVIALPDAKVTRVLTCQKETESCCL